MLSALLGLYIAALIFGGGLLSLSVLGASHGHDHDGDGHADSDHADDHHHAAADFVSVFLSLRFWTFFLCFGGAAGTILTLAGIPSTMTGVASGGLGLACGLTAALVVRALSRSQVSSGMSADDWNGREAKVVLPVSAARPGKIRLELTGEIKDLLATCAVSDGEIPIGAEVLIAEVVDGVAKVTTNRPSSAVPRKLQEKA